MGRLNRPKHTDDDARRRILKEGQKCFNSIECCRGKQFVPVTPENAVDSINPKQQRMESDNKQR